MPEGDAPISPPQPATPVASAGTAAPSETILVVDDNAANRDALARRLERRGYTVLVAGDGLAALDALARRHVDLVLLDVMMPGITGLEVLERVRRDRTPADLPVIMATARDQSEDLIRALGMGANDYVTKPLDFGVCLARCRTHLALKRSVEQIRELERRLSARNRDLEAANAMLVDAADRARRELALAARVQESLLPKSAPRIPGLEFAWAFKPCRELAGDSLNICPFDDGRVGLYVLDVAGHGVSAALLAVAATRLLSPSDPDSILVDRASPGGGGPIARTPVPPAEVAARLEQRFAWNPDTEQFLTIFYALLDPATRQFAYVSAGHPGAIRLSPATPPTVLDAGGGLPIGLGGSHETQSLLLRPGDRIFLYSDGLTEALNPQGQQFGCPRVMQFLQHDRAFPSLHQTIDALMHEIGNWCGPIPAQDDVSVLAVELAGE
jgi:sigma-B regulation protein RsbU (phosphoserine phosphatase)